MTELSAAATHTAGRSHRLLTARELQVIEALSQGLSNREIGVRLNIAVHTVKSHVHNVLEKLSLRSRLEIAAFSHAASRENAPVGR